MSRFEVHDIMIIEISGIQIWLTKWHCASIFFFFARGVGEGARIEVSDTREMR